MLKRFKRQAAICSVEPLEGSPGNDVEVSTTEEGVRNGGTSKLDK